MREDREQWQRESLDGWTAGGRISLRSPAGAGTVLEIALPLDDPDGEARVWSYAG